MCHLAPLRDGGGLGQVFSQTNYKHGRGQAVTSLGKQEKTNRAPPHSPTGRTGVWGGTPCTGRDRLTPTRAGLDPDHSR